MTVRRCQCGQSIEWLTTGGGRRAPFMHPLTPIADAPPDAWTIIVTKVKGVRKAVAVPLEGVQGHWRDGIRHVLVRHECPLRVRPAIPQQRPSDAAHARGTP